VAQVETARHRQFLALAQRMPEAVVAEHQMLELEAQEAAEMAAILQLRHIPEETELLIPAAVEVVVGLAAQHPAMVVTAAPAS